MRKTKQRIAIAESCGFSYHWHATAAQRAEAFLKTHGLWED